MGEADLVEEVGACGVADQAQGHPDETHAGWRAKAHPVDPSAPGTGGPAHGRRVGLQ